MGSVRRAQKQRMRDRCILIVGVVVAISSIDLRRARLLLRRRQARQVFPLCVTVFGMLIDQILLYSNTYCSTLDISTLTAAKSQDKVRQTRVSFCPVPFPPFP